MENQKYRSPTGGGTSKGYQSNAHSKLKIRDNMDGVLETNGFYRKHVAHEPDSIYRAVSDVLFDTQFYRHLVKKVHNLFQRSEEGQLFLKKNKDSILSEDQDVADAKYDVIRSIAHIFKRPIEIVYTSGPSVKILKFHPHSNKMHQKSANTHPDQEYPMEHESYLGCYKNPKKISNVQAHNITHNSKYVMHAAVSNAAALTVETSDSVKGVYEYGSGGSSNSSPVKCKKEASEEQLKESIHSRNLCQDQNRGRSRRRNRDPILLCHSAPYQYDPVYKSDHISNAGFVQSVLYEMLYKEVFKMTDAVDAADFMLNAEVLGKPDVYDKEFEGTAMQALDNNLIPFPYKVAKALDPEHYRNIEYDVWTCEKRGNSSSRSNSASSISRGRQRKSSSPNSSNGPQTIGNLKRGTACIVRSPPYQDIYGYVQGLTTDNRNVEVYVPLFEYSIFVARKCILPVQTLPQEFSSLRKSPTSQGKSEARHQPEPVHTRIFYSNNRGMDTGNPNNNNGTYQNDEGYGSPTKSGEMNDLELSRREDMCTNLSADTSTSPNTMEQRLYIAANPEFPRSPHHGYNGCSAYPGCPVCYPPGQQLQSTHNPPNVVVNLSTNINNLPSPFFNPIQTRVTTNQHMQNTDDGPDYEVEEIQNRNILLARNRDPAWLRKIDFRVPPPNINNPNHYNGTQSLMQNRAPVNLGIGNSVAYLNADIQDYSSLPRDENNNDGNEFLKRSGMNDITKITIEQTMGSPIASSYHLPSYEASMMQSYSETMAMHPHNEELIKVQSPTTPNVVFGYPTNLLVDIPHSPVYPIPSARAGNTEHIPQSDGRGIMQTEVELEKEPENNSIPPLYVPVPYSFLGPMLNSGTHDESRPAMNANCELVKPRDRIVPSLQNLQIDQTHICPSTPLATPSIPMPNLMQNAGPGQVQIFQFPDPVQSILPIRAAQTNVPWAVHQSFSTQGIERPQEYSEHPRAVFNYIPPRM